MPILLRIKSILPWMCCLWLCSCSGNVKETSSIGHTGKPGIEHFAVQEQILHTGDEIGGMDIYLKAVEDDVVTFADKTGAEVFSGKAGDRIHLGRYSILGVYIADVNEGQVQIELPVSYWTY